jgi:hypothetical protein
VYGACLLAHLGGEVSGPSFWAGTLFPDIRHLGVVSRRRTHMEGVSLETLAGANDFATGMRVHVWVDATRDQFLREANMKELLPWHPFVPHALKLLEDEFLYEKFDDWNLIHRVLSKVYDEELEYVHSKQHVLTWHSILQNYFQQAPTDESRLALSKAIGLSGNSAMEINSVVKLLRSDEETEKLMERFLRHLELLLQ